MKDICLDNIQISKDTRILEYEDNLVLGNVRKTGLWIKIKAIDFYHVKKYIGQRDGFNTLIRSLESEEEYKYYVNLLNALAEIKVLERKGDKDVSNINNISIELTTACNLRCKHCSEQYGDRVSLTMEMSSLSKIVLWAESNFVSSITLTGGEIFCLSDINEKLIYVRNNFSGKISIITNATIIKKQNMKILKENVDEINISLDGYDQNSVDLIRGEGVYEKVIDTIKQLHETGFENILVSMVLTSDNKKNIDKFRRLCESINVKPITRILAIKGRAFENYDVLVKTEDKGLEEGISEKVNMLSLCNAGISTISFDANEMVTLCPTIEQSNLALGTIENLNSITKKIKDLNEECIVDTIEPCRSCLVRYFCSSMCYSMNLNVFMSPELRLKRCEKNKDILMKYVWGI